MEALLDRLAIFHRYHCLRLFVFWTPELLVPTIRVSKMSTYPLFRLNWHRQPGAVHFLNSSLQG
jgi:hypothetical protein